MDQPVIDTVISLDAHHAAGMVADRELGHRQVSELFGHRESRTPRAELNLLWTVPSVNVTTGVGELLIRANSEPTVRPEWVGDLAASTRTAGFTTGQRVAFQVELAAQKSPSVPMPREIREPLKAGATGHDRQPGDGLCWRPNKIPVPDTELDEWLTAKFARSGLDATINHTHRSTIWFTRKRGGLPVVHTHAHGTITDPDEWAHAIAYGLPGKGKPYGTGTIVDTPHA